MDPITDIFSTMHVTAFGQHRLEATATWGLIQEKQTEEKVTPSGKRISRTDLAHFAMLSRGNYCSVSKASRTRFPSPVATASCWPEGLRLFCAIAREHVQGHLVPQPRLQGTSLPFRNRVAPTSAETPRPHLLGCRVWTAPASGRVFFAERDVFLRRGLLC